MNINKLLLLVAGLCVLAAVVIYGHALWKADSETIPLLDTPNQKVSPASVDDGTYVVYLRSIMTNGEDTTVRFSHVTYFEGEEARRSAEHEVTCEEGPLESCVPTLTRGYYVRPSSAPEFTAPLTADTVITLKDKEGANGEDLRTIRRDMQPVFEVRIENGVAISIKELSPIAS